MINKSGWAEWLTDEGKTILQSGYLLEGETQLDMFHRVAFAASSKLPDELQYQAYPAFIKILSEGWLSLASPVAANMGANRGMPISCFAMTPHNSIDGIFKTAHESAMLSKSGGGLGIDLTPLVGPTQVEKWAKIYDNIAGTVSQGGDVRKGSIAIYLDIEHPDILSFLHSKELLEGDTRTKIDSNIAVKISDEFVHKLMAEEPEAVKVFSKVLELRMKYGSPYIFFSDNVARQDPECYKDKGLKTTTSNLCFPGDTLVMVYQDNCQMLVPIKELRDKTFNVYSLNEETQQIEIKGAEGFSTGENPTVLLTLSDGSVLECTSNHPLYTLEHGWKAAEDCLDYTLKPYVNKKNGFLKVVEIHYNGILETFDLTVADNHNFYVSHPTMKGNNAYLAHNCFRGDTEVITKQGVFEIKDLVGKTVDVFDGREWVSNSNFKSYGMDTLLRVTLKSGEYIDMTPDHRCLLKQRHGKLKEVKAKDLNIGDTLAESDIFINKYAWKGRISRAYEIVNIEVLPGEHEVYCTSVPSTTHFTLANGVLIGNCQEITLYTDPKHSFICCLSSLNLFKLNEWVEWNYDGQDIVFWSLLFLDCVLQEFIDKSEGVEGLQNARRSAVKGRALGLGVIGYHSLLQSKGISFGSELAYRYNENIFNDLCLKKEVAQQELARLLGVPEWCEGFPQRNTHSFAIAPTTTNSVIGGGVSAGIEPIASNYMVVSGSKGTFVRRNKVLATQLENIYKGNPEGLQRVWNHIRDNDGSLRGLEKELGYSFCQVFLTAKEIDQTHLIHQAADRQKYIDQGQSLNLFVSPDCKPETLYYYHLLGWKLGLKGFYYIRSQSKSLMMIQSLEGQTDKTQSFTIYSRPDCIYCQQAKELLDKLDLPYVEYYQEKGKVPQIYVGDTLIGGYTELKLRLLPSEEGEENGCAGCDG